MATSLKQKRRLRIRRGIRKKLEGTSQRPRLAVFRSSKYIYAQLINDLDGRTLVACTSRELEETGTKTDKARAVGKKLAERAKGAVYRTGIF